MKLKIALTTTLLLSLLTCSVSVSRRAMATAVAPPSEATFKGMCEASAAVALGMNMFVVANDEDNMLRVYSREATDAPLQLLRLSKIFGAQQISDGKDETNPDDDKVDIEGAAWLGEMIFWIGSHSISNKGNRKPARESLFALRINYDGDGLRAVSEGRVYKTLLEDLAKVTAYDVFNLKKAKTIKPKELGGLSIEGLAATPAGELLIAFRNPLGGGQVVNNRLVGGKALIVTLKNPLEVIAAKPAPAQFGAPVELDLGGFGIRSIEFNARRQSYYIVAGPYDKSDETFRLYQWTGKQADKPQEMDSSKLKGLFPEVLFFYPPADAGTAGQMQLLSDDGDKCDKQARTFRGLLHSF